MRKKTEIIDGVKHIYLPCQFDSFVPMKEKSVNPNRKYKIIEGMKVMVEENLNGIKVRYLQYHEELCKQ